MNDDRAMVQTAMNEEDRATLERFWLERFEQHRTCGSCPSLGDVRTWFSDLLGLLFEQHATSRYTDFEEFRAEARRLEEQLVNMVSASLTVSAGGTKRLAGQVEGLVAEQVADQVAEHVAGEDVLRGVRQTADSLAATVIRALPEIHDSLIDDASAILRADPAARSLDEVIRAYPGFYAIAAYRVAHVLHGHGALLLARMLSSAAHGSTGIDIHPAAVIGKRFCIDHGTGVVIGETAIVGDDVTLYQGVTLGGLSVRKSDAHSKRHPTIQDRVIIYSGATILGGTTVVGHDSVIGGNVWLTQPVPPYSRLTYKAAVSSESEQQP